MGFKASLWGAYIQSLKTIHGLSGVFLRSRKITLQLLFFVLPHQLILKYIKDYFHYTSREINMKKRWPSQNFLLMSGMRMVRR
uniref:Uncharacterized protein n=1 Tax=Salix viminalis TaxID=40686 RepID=A0A6N2NKS1_SALVM